MDWPEWDDLTYIVRSVRAGVRGFKVWQKVAEKGKKVVTMTRKRRD